MAWLKWYEIIKKALMVIVLIAVIFIAYQYPTQISKILSGFEIDHTSGVINRELEMSVDGVISKSIIGSNRFWGMINIGNLEIKVDKDFPILLNDMDNIQALINFPDEGVEFTNIGIIYTDHTLSKIMILKNDESSDFSSNRSGAFGSNDGAIIYVSSVYEDDIIGSINNMLKETYFKSLEITR
jgi:hypothetical protein